MSADELALARAAITGDAEAIREFERAFAGVITAVCRRFAGKGHDEDDLRQILRDKLLVGSSPTLGDYDGSGSLASWIRVTASRTFIDLGRRKDRARELPASDELDAALATVDLGLDVIKSEYRAAVTRALHAAVQALPTGDRHLLRQALVVGLTIDQLGLVLGIHRATAARRVEKAREALAAATREQLSRELSLDERELAEVFDLVASRFDVSLRTLLATK